MQTAHLTVPADTLGKIKNNTILSKRRSETFHSMSNESTKQVERKNNYRISAPWKGKLQERVWILARCTLRYTYRHMPRYECTRPLSSSNGFINRNVQAIPVTVVKININ